MGKILILFTPKAMARLWRYPISRGGGAFSRAKTPKASASLPSPSGAGFVDALGALIFLPSPVRFHGVTLT
jgi:hypothetical protein